MHRETSLHGKLYHDILRECLDEATLTEDVSVSKLDQSRVLPGLQVSDFGEIGPPLHPLLVEGLKKTGEELTKHVFVWNAGRKRHEASIENDEWMRQMEDELRKTAELKNILTGGAELKLHSLVIEEASEREYVWPLKRNKGAHFGYLLVVLPTMHRGGQMKVSLGDEERTSTAEHSQYLHQFLFFFKECQLISQPITMGYRVQLVFRLSVKEGLPPQWFKGVEHVKKVRGAVELWREDERGTEALCYPLSKRDAEENLTQQKIARLASKSFGLGCYFGKIDRRTSDSVVKIKSWGRHAFDTALWLKASKYAKTVIVFTKYDDVERLTVHFAQSNVYFSRLMDRVELLLPEEIMGILHAVPDDIIDHILSHYVPMEEMEGFYFTSRRCMERVCNVTDAAIRRMVQTAVQMKRSDILCDWFSLADSPRLLSRSEPYRDEIIANMPPIDTPRLDFTNHVMKLLHHYGGHVIAPKMIDFIGFHFGSSHGYRYDLFQIMDKLYEQMTEGSDSVLTVIPVSHPIQIITKYSPFVCQAYEEILDMWMAARSDDLSTLTLARHLSKVGRWEHIKTVWKQFCERWNNDVHRLWTDGYKFAVVIINANDRSPWKERHQKVPPVIHRVIVDLMGYIKIYLEEDTVCHCNYCRQVMELLYHNEMDELTFNFPKSIRKHVIDRYHIERKTMITEEGGTMTIKKLVRMKRPKGTKFDTARANLRTHLRSEDEGKEKNEGKREREKEVEERKRMKGKKRMEEGTKKNTQPSKKSKKTIN
ncbi:hypothetical protein PROFUN_08426 [Planoprotostelium fungivorum]|uniref:Uncharacterized protein n=1 Tax=Planoprotostelium fungivorum TaxID=1890364 RepID=A0A2P6NJW0_9EUKA|nr:hypothetical protein PROFUN_08426 [Planoprotostelium fungivorum]